MNAKIFYFSGTGNSLFVAKKINVYLGKGEIISIPNIDKNTINIKEDIIGIVFPVYSQTYPPIIREFVNKLIFNIKPYIFSVATNNGGPGTSNFDLDKLLKKKNMKLNSGFELLMPGNSVIIKDFTTPIDERELRLKNAHYKIIKISELIMKQTDNKLEGNKSIKWIIEGKITSIARKIYKVHKHFRTNSECNKCGSCVKLCPNNNIQILDEVKWDNKCYDCLACFHWCPKKSIELNKNSVNIQRYHHPEIAMKEMFLK